MQAERFRSDSSGCTASDRSGLVGERQRECGGISGGALLRLGLSGERPSSDTSLGADLFCRKLFIMSTVPTTYRTKLYPAIGKRLRRPGLPAPGSSLHYSSCLGLYQFTMQLELQKLNPAQTQFKVLCQAFFQESVPRPPSLPPQQSIISSPPATD